MSKTSSVSRRKLLKIAGGAGAAATAGVAGAKLFAPAIAGPAPKVRLAWTEVAACHSPLGFGVDKGIFAKHGVDVELFYANVYATLIIMAAICAGQVKLLFIIRARLLGWQAGFIA